MTVIEQDHQLRRGEPRQRCVCSGGPPQELAGGEAAQTQPEPIPVIDQQFQGRGLAIPEHKQCARKRVLLPLVRAEGCERIQAFAEINGFDRQQNT
jgi:hypothetical protein